MDLRFGQQVVAVQDGVYPRGQGFALARGRICSAAGEPGAHLQAFSQERPVGKNR